MSLDPQNDILIPQNDAFANLCLLTLKIIYIYVYTRRITCLDPRTDVFRSTQRIYLDPQNGLDPQDDEFKLAKLNL